MVSIYMEAVACCVPGKHCMMEGRVPVLQELTVRQYFCCSLLCRVRKPEQ